MSDQHRWPRHDLRRPRVRGLLRIRAGRSVRVTDYHVVSDLRLCVTTATDVPMEEENSRSQHDSP